MTLGPGTIRHLPRAGGRMAWVCDWTDEHGARHRQELAATKRESRERLAAIIAERDARLAGHTGDPTLGEVLAAYAQHIARTGSAATVHGQRSRAKVLTDWLGADRRASEITATVLARYQAERGDAGASNRTINNDLSTLRAALRRAARLGMLDAGAIATIEPLPTGGRHKRRETRALSEDECGALLAAAEGQGAEMHSLFATMLTLGTRRNETILTPWSDVDMDGLTFRVGSLRAKNGRERVLPLPGDLAALIDAVPRHADPLVWHVKRAKLAWRLDKAIKAAGIDPRGVHVHALRHTAATRLARAGVPLQQTQYLLGHSTPELTSRVYTHLHTEDVREAVGALPVGAVGNKSAMDEDENTAQGGPNDMQAITLRQSQVHESVQGTSSSHGVLSGSSGCSDVPIEHHGAPRSTPGPGGSRQRVGNGPRWPVQAGGPRWLADVVLGGADGLGGWRPPETGAAAPLGWAWGGAR